MRNIWRVFCRDFWVGEAPEDYLSVLDIMDGLEPPPPLTSFQEFTFIPL